MTTFTDLMTSPPSAPNRCYRWERREDSLWMVGVLTIEDRRDTQAYEVDETATDAGRAFTLRKPGGGFYCVDVRGWGADRCSCHSFQYGGGKPCKHLEAVRGLIAQDQL